ncbi:MAG: tetratricopeptide repeat protein [Thermoanaerobaculia bacterium]
MPDSPTSPRIEELRARLAADPKSRLFYPLAEELRKIGRVEEAEKVLREGLTIHANYLSAWVSFGRVLKDRKNFTEAVTVLERALSLDPGNVVAAKLLAEAHLGTGNALEAIKKYKLVYALMPGDDSIEEIIGRLERELHPMTVSVADEGDSGEIQTDEARAREEAEVPPPNETGRASETKLSAPGSSTEGHLEPETPFADWGATRSDADESTEADEAPDFTESNPFEPAGEDEREDVAALSSFEESPGAETSHQASPWVAAEPEPEEPPFHPTLAGQVPVYQEEGDEEPQRAPFEEERGSTATGGQASGSPFEDAAEPGHGEPTVTVTLGDLYARQGHVGAAREIYTRILERDGENAEVRRKLDSLPDAPAALGDQERREKVDRLERWLARVRDEARRV